MLLIMFLLLHPQLRATQQAHKSEHIVFNNKGLPLSRQP